MARLIKFTKATGDGDGEPLYINPVAVAMLEASRHEGATLIQLVGPDEDSVGVRVAGSLDEVAHRLNGEETT